MAQNRFLKILILSALAWILVALLALLVGSAELNDLALIVQLRLPRVILAAGVGLGLAVAGAVLQALFANPLCEPYTLGISSGAALGAVIGGALGSTLNFAGLAGSSFIGAITFMGVLYLVSLRAGITNFTLLLTGVMLNFLGSSLIAVWVSLGEPSGIQAALVWLFGDLSRARLQGAVFSVFSVLSICSLILNRSKDLDGMLMGEEDALALGVSVTQARRRLIFLSSVLIGICVSGAGMIGFLGLVVPHFVRQFTGSLHHRMLPVCAVWGAIALTLADTLARVVARPTELPVGVVTALIGAPLFFWIMVHKRNVST